MFQIRGRGKNKKKEACVCMHISGLYLGIVHALMAHKVICMEIPTAEEKTVWGDEKP